MSGWPIKFCRFLLFCSFIGHSVAGASSLAPSKFQVICEKALIGLGLYQPSPRALIEPIEGPDAALEAGAYNPSSYDLFLLNELSYFPPQFLSPEYLRGKKVLDLNCGEGTLVEELRRLGVDTVGQSILLNKYQLTKPYFVQASATATGLPDRGADLIISNLGVITRYWDSHPDYVRRVLKEAKRVLRKGGTILISPIHIAMTDPTGVTDVSPEALLAKTVFANLPAGLRIKSAPDRNWLKTYRDPELDIGRPRRANYWLELERTD